MTARFRASLTRRRCATSSQKLAPISPRSLYVGDSNVDIDTARRAGVPVCLARYGFGYLRGESGLDDADWTIEAPMDLLAVIDAAVTKGPARSSR